MTRARVLLVKPVLPYPPDQGTKVVSFALLEAMAGRYDVTVLARRLSADDDRHVRALEAMGVRVVSILPANRRHRAARLAFRLAYSVRSFATGRSLKGLYDCPGAFVRAARRLAREPFDLVILEYWQLAPLLRVFDASRTVLLTHDVDMLVNRERLRIENGGVRRSLLARRWRSEEREEVRAYRHARRIWTLTARDADSVRTIAPEAAVDVMPFGLPASSFARDLPARTSREVLFLGALTAVFNRDALAYFVHDLHPQLATIEGIRFTVVGGALPAEVESFRDLPNVEVPGHTGDVRVYLDRAACLIVPLRFGGGLRIRIIEALATGLPVVCSALAVEGMGLVAGRHVLVARDPGEYRAAVDRVLNDPAFAADLAREARERVLGLYGPSARDSGLSGFVAAAIAGPATSDWKRPA